MKYISFSFMLLVLACTSSDLISVKEDGVLVETYQIDQDSLRHGISKKFYASGQPFEIAQYEHGKLNGERFIFYESGVVEIKENYCGGIFCDTLTTYHPNGEKKFQGIYNHGILSGIVKGYYMTGELKEEVYFIDNIEQGPFTEYHKNGKVKWQGTYLNGPNEFGELTEYNEEGKKLKIMQCDTLAICKTVWSAED